MLLNGWYRTEWQLVFTIIIFIIYDYVMLHNMKASYQCSCHSKKATTYIYLKKVITCHRFLINICPLQASISCRTKTPNLTPLRKQCFQKVNKRENTKVQCGIWKHKHIVHVKMSNSKRANPVSAHVCGRSQAAVAEAVGVEVGVFSIVGVRVGVDVTSEMYAKA